jgi:hypothetical protein
MKGELIFKILTEILSYHVSTVYEVIIRPCFLVKTRPEDDCMNGRNI